MEFALTSRIISTLSALQYKKMIDFVSFLKLIHDTFNIKQEERKIKMCSGVLCCLIELLLHNMYYILSSSASEKLIYMKQINKFPNHPHCGPKIRLTSEIQSSDNGLFHTHTNNSSTTINTVPYNFARNPHTM